MSNTLDLQLLTEYVTRNGRTAVVTAIHHPNPYKPVDPVNNPSARVYGYIKEEADNELAGLVCWRMDGRRFEKADSGLDLIL